MTEIDLKMEIMNNILSEFETFVVVDLEERVVFLNDNYAKILNIDSEKAIGMFVKDLIPGTQMQKVLNSGKEDIGSLFELKDGRTIVCNRLPIKKNGKLLGAIAFATFKKMDEITIFMERINALNAELSIYKRELGILRGAKYSLEQIIGNDQKIQEIKELIKKIAHTKSTVLITGETGTGKELFAHAIHEQGPRKHKSLVRINCAAIPSELLESELFGYEEGSFTGAKKGGKPGKFELANGGSLILDEVHLLPLNFQAKLLRTIQEREIERVGSIKSRSIDVRLICISNVDLKSLVEKGEFREDLYYRIDVVHIEVPPLRDRLTDIDSLVKMFILKLNNELSLNITGIEPDIIKLFKSYYWPGNIRELEHSIERAANYAVSGMLSKENFEFLYERQLVQSNNLEMKEGASLQEIREQSEKIAIIKSLIKNNGNKSAASRDLNIDRSVLYDKIEKYKL